jgi:hypothetical protein
MYRKNHRNDPGLCLCWFWTTSSNKKTNSLYHKFIRWYKKKYFVHSYSFSFVKLVPLADKKLWEIPTTDSYLLQFRDWTPLASEHVCLIIFMRSWFFLFFSIFAFGIDFGLFGHTRHDCDPLAAPSLHVAEEKESTRLEVSWKYANCKIQILGDSQQTTNVKGGRHLWIDKWDFNINIYCYWRFVTIRHPK